MRISDWSSDVCSSDLGNVRPRGAHAGSRGSRRYTLKGSMMADGWAHDGAVQEQIEDTVADAVKIARSRIASGAGTPFCEDCGMEIPAARRKAMASSRTCVFRQDKSDAAVRPAARKRPSLKPSPLTAIPLPASAWTQTNNN